MATAPYHAEIAAFKSLGEVADKLCNPFFRGGRLEEQNNILLHYKSKEAGEPREIRLPGAENESLTQLLSAGSALERMVSKSQISAIAIH